MEEKLSTYDTAPRETHTVHVELDDRGQALPQDNQPKRDALEETEKKLRALKNCRMRVTVEVWDL